MLSNNVFLASMGTHSLQLNRGNILVFIDPVKPMIKLSEPAREIPVGDGSPVTMNIDDNVTAASNTTITITCPVRGVPTPTVTWQKDGVPVIAGGNIFLINGKQKLIVRVANGEDSGKYSCSVENNFGKDSLSSTVTIMGKCLIQAFLFHCSKLIAVL